MSELREAAQEALFWMQHARLHLTIKERLHPDGLIQYDNAARNLLAALAQPETESHPPRDEWREAVLGALEICMILNDTNRDDPERALSDLMAWEPRAATGDKKAKCYEVLDLMRRNEVSIKDLSFVIAEFSVEGGLKETQQKIKGFLYTDKNMIEPDASKEE